MTWRTSTWSNATNCVEAEAGDWRKSQHSNPNGACVEVGNDFRKSSHSNSDDCVEVASGVKVRDTTDRGGPVLLIPAAAWIAFTGRVKQLP